jgi:hypothetical protein
MWALITLGASLVPFLLVAAIIRGGLRGRRDRAALRDIGKVYE